MIRHDISLENEIFKIYDKLDIGESITCLNCRDNTQNLSRPVSFWFVGQKYLYSKYKLLFIGKNARGNPGISKNSYLDSRGRADELWKISWPYWSYTRSISDELYGTDSGDYIAYTNIMKCNNSDTIDTTSNLMKDNCIAKMRIIREEIRVLKPRNIVFLTSNEYDDYFNNIFDEILSIRSESVNIGKKKMPCWEFTGIIENTKINVLRIGHPERKNKLSYVSLVSSWAKDQK